MNRSTRILFISFFIFYAFTSRAQNTLKSFTPDSLKFIDELSGFFDNANKKEGKDFIEDQFKKTCWLVPGKWTGARRTFVYNTCNELLNRRFRPYPEFQNFLLALMNFYKSGLSDQVWNDWQNSMEKLVSKSKSNNKEVYGYLEASMLLFEGSIFFRSNALTWSASSGDYVISYAVFCLKKYNIIDLSDAAPHHT